MHLAYNFYYIFNIFFAECRKAGGGAIGLLIVGLSNLINFEFAPLIADSQTLLLAQQNAGCLMNKDISNIGFQIKNLIRLHVKKTLFDDQPGQFCDTLMISLITVTCWVVELVNLDQLMTSALKAEIL